LREAYAAPERADISNKLDRLVARTGWPRFVFTQKAMALGINSTRQKWTTEEDAYLREHAQFLPISEIAHHLGKARQSVEARLKTLPVACLLAEYSVSDLRARFGVSESRVLGWIRRGLLGRIHSAPDVIIPDGNVRRFISRNHAEYDLGKVQQTWFVAMVFTEDTDRIAAVTPEVSRGSSGSVLSPQRGAVREQGETGSPLVRSGRAVSSPLQRGSRTAEEEAAAD
jgi:hypothetical protein